MAIGIRKRKSKKVPNMKLMAISMKKILRILKNFMDYLINLKSCFLSEVAKEKMQAEKYC